MYKIKIFNGNKPELLQTTVNDWLQANKDVVIHNSNLYGNTENPVSNEYYFYILYSSSEAQAEELKEMAAVVTQEQSIDVKEINPEILKPSS